MTIRRRSPGLKLALLALLAMNIALSAVNYANLRTVNAIRTTVDEQIAAARGIQASRPQHPCGDVIMPGEECTMQFHVMFPDPAAEKTY